jgi:lipid-binding SYLF domain-containing protein
MRKVHGSLALLVLLALGCATAPETKEGREDLVAEARQALARMETSDPSLGPRLQHSHAYAVFPGVGQGGFIVGATYGRGVVFRGGEVIGYADLKAGQVGLVAGGQAFEELVIFQDAGALTRMVNQGLSFEASATATALKAGVAGSVPFREGIAVFVKPRAGLMASVAIGGQEIDFVAKPAGKTY